MKTTQTLALVLAATVAIHSQTSSSQDSATQRIEVAFSGGHETDPRDHGRPDVLIAAALGVPTDVFRDAFSRVTPANNGRGPTDEEARRNKSILMQALGPHGVTDGRLNTVSNYYRYSRQNGEQLWRVTPAAAFATVQDGKITGFTIANPGSGYSSEPKVSIPGMPDVKVKTEIGFSTDFAKNGSVHELTLALAK